MPGCLPAETFENESLPGTTAAGGRPPLSHRPRGRRREWRHGHGRPRPRHAARLPHRDQGAPSRASHGGGGAAVPARGADPRQSAPPQHRPDPGLRLEARHLLLHHAVARRRDAGAATRAWASLDARVAAVGRRAARGARRGSPPRRDPPGREAEQRIPRGRPRRAHGFRRGHGTLALGGEVDGTRRVDRDARVHGPGADRWRRHPAQ